MKQFAVATWGGDLVYWVCNLLTRCKETTMYTTKNFKTKKAVKDAIEAGEVVTVFQPNQVTASVAPPRDGVDHLEGPHYPEPHRWYAEGTMKDGRLVRIK